MPRGALILRASATGHWRAVPIESGLRIVSWFAPATRTMVLAGGSATPPSSATSFPERLQRIRLFLFLLPALGWISLLGLVLGLSLAAAHFGGWGFLFAAAGLLLVAMLMYGLTAWALVRTGMSGKEAAWVSLKLLSPFAAGRAIEVLLEGAARDVPPLVVARTLMSSAEFSRWIRPRVFDRQQSGSADMELDLAMTPEERHTLVASAPEVSLGGATYCRRCGDTFNRESGDCPDCGVALVRRARD